MRTWTTAGCEQGRKRALAEGFLLPEDAADLMQRALRAANRWPVAGERAC
ncbi:hypothetical protein [Fontimonas thermophila]|nr:hypothetical protein [Fontimonas thermophila]